MDLKCGSDFGKNYRQAIYKHVSEISLQTGFIDADESIIQDTRNFVINSLLDKYAISESGKPTVADQKELANAIVEILEINGVNIGDRNTLINTIIDQWLRSDELTLGKRESVSTEKLVKLSDEEIYRLSFNQDYMQDAFGGSNKTMLDAKKQARKMLTRAFIYSSNGVINTNKALKEAVMREQQALLDTVLNYLRYEYSSNSRITEEGQLVLNNYRKMFNEKGKYLDVLKMIEQVFGQVFEKPKNLFELQVKADGAKGFEVDDDAKRYIEAYRSWVLLKNFSSLVEDTFGKAVQIDKDLDEYDPERYQIGTEGSNVYTTWRTKDEIFLSEELNNVVQLIITSSPMYTYGNESPIDDVDLRLNDFNYIIGKIKNFAESINASDTKKFQELKQTRGLNFSKETSAIVKECSSLAELINKIRLNPSKYIPALFEILSNPKAYSKLIISGTSSDIRLGSFNANDKNLIYTIYKNFFDRSNSESLISNQEKVGFMESNYFGYLTQVIDSVFTNKYLQYYRDESGNIKLRGMMGQQLDNLRSRVEREIQSKHARKAIVYSDYSKKYNINPTLESSTDESVKRIKKVDFDIPMYSFDKNGDKVASGRTLHVVINSLFDNGIFTEEVNYDIKDKSGKILFSKVRNKVEYQDETLKYEDVFNEISHFIEDMIGYDVSSDKFKKAYSATINSQNPIASMTTELLDFSSRILFRIYVSSELMKDSKGDYIKYKTEARQRVNQLFGLISNRNNKNNENIESIYNANKYIHPITGEIKLVNSNKDLQTLRNLATAFAYIRDLATSSVVKDGSGNALSADSLSKLGASYHSQWLDQNSKEDSATKHYMILDPELFMGLFQAKEFKDYSADVSKSHVDFNPTEMLDATLLYDYFANMVSNDKDLDHNKVFFLASVNSDKSNIGRIKINLDYSVEGLFSPLLNPITNFLSELTLPKSLTYSQQSVNSFNKFCKDNNTTAELVIREAAKNKEIPIDENFYFDLGGNLVINPNLTETGTLAEIIRKPNGEDIFRNIIRLQLGKFYRNIIKNINNDLAKLNELLPETIFQNESGDYYTPNLEYTEESYNKFNNWCRSNGYVPAEYLNQLVARYNYSHPNNIITLTDQIHITGKKDISINKTLVELSKVLSSKEKTDEYFDQANEQIFKQLLKDDFQITTNKPESVRSKLKSLYNNSEQSEWFNEQNGKVVLGIISYINASGQLVNKKITQNTDLITIAEDLGIDPNSNFQQIKDKIEELYRDRLAFSQEAPINSDSTDVAAFKVTLNPQIAKYNALNYLVNQEWLSSTVGTHMAHPSKANFKNKPYNLIEDEASRFGAQHKRNVSFTASMHEFQLNLLNGIPSEYNVSIIREITDDLYNIVGLTDDGVSPYDGATFVNPFIVYLENYSLGGAKVGVNKKQFVHYYDEHTGNGGIIKTAGFGLTNLLISDSPQMKTMMYNMTKRIWRNPDDSEFIGNVFETYDGNVIYTGEDAKEDGYNLGPIYYRDNTGRVVLIQSIEKAKGDNQYLVKRNYVTDENAIDDRYSGELKPEIVTIKSNWDLWNLFGAEKSVEYDEYSRKFVQSENSIKLVVNMMNRVGIKTSKDIARTQSDVYQFMKHSDIHYMPVDGSVKQGAANMNDSSWWNKRMEIDENGNAISGLNFMKVKMNQAGIQLDKEHNADSEEVSLMTQVISACAQRGFTLGRSTAMYQALASLARVGMQDQFKALQELFEVKMDGLEEQYEDYESAFQETVVDLVFDSLIHQSETSDLVSKIAKDFVQEAKLGKKIQFKSTPGKKDGLDSVLPYSIDEIYKKIHSIINVGLTKASIKIKLPGILSILCPSFNIMKLYGDKLYHEYLNPEVELEEVQRQYDANPIWSYQPGKLFDKGIQLGRTYKITFNGLFSDDVLNEIVTTGKFNGIKTELESIGDNTTTLRMFINTPPDYDFVKQNLLNEKNGTVDVETVIEHPDTGLPVETTVPVNVPRIVKISEYIKEGRNLGHYNAIFRGSDGQIYNLWDLDSVKLCYKLEANKANPEQIKEARRAVQRDMFKLHNGDGIVFINSTPILIEEKLEEIPYEVIMPKTAKTDFGLSTGDNLSEIIANKDFFTEKILNNYASRIPSQFYELELKKTNGKHTYLMTKDRLEEIQEGTFGNLLKRRSISKLTIDGEIWRMDPDTKERMYKLSSDDDYIYIYDTGKEKIEIIVTDNLEHYIGTQKFNHAVISQELNNTPQFENIKRILIDCSDENSSYYNPALQRQFDSIVEDTFESFNTKLAQLNGRVDLSDPSMKFVFSSIKRSGNEVYASFKKSLEIIAARIPAQSMQSFMPMKIAGFDNSDRNTAYVSTAQIWLQGSDYDIDAVTLTNFSFDRNGKYVTWSPLANISSFEALKASDKLPFPNGQTVELLTGKNRNKPNIPKFKLDTTKLIDKNGKALRTPNAILEWAKVLDYVNKYGRGNIYSDQPKEQVDKIYEIVNQHNLYIDVMYKKDRRLLEDAVKNYMLTQMYEISIDPVNLPASQAPVDRSTKPLKDSANQREDIVAEQQESTPASFVNQIHSIYENQVGKTGVGICAVGLKSYFATTQAINQIVDDGTLREKQRCALGKNGKGIEIDGKIYRAFSNSYKQNSDPYKQITDEELQFRNFVLDKVQKLNQIQRNNYIDSELKKRGLTRDDKSNIVNEIEQTAEKEITLEETFNGAKHFFVEEYPEFTELINSMRSFGEIITPDIILTAVNNDQDAAVNLSALLSLATDNAKELALAKMNAGTGMLGTYIYGLAIGVDFNTMFKILTSPAALEISKLLRGNSFEDDPALMVSQIENYIKNGPLKQINSFVQTNGLTALLTVVPELSALLKEASTTIDVYGLSELLTKVKNIDTLEHIRSKYRTDVQINQLLDMCEKYVQSANIISKDSHFEDLKTLFKGAEEYRKLGQILHVNQGLYTSIPDSLNYLNNFQNLIYTESKKKEDKIDILRFCLDEQYRESAIDMYEAKAKHTINILQIVSKVPHFLEYLRVVATADAMMESISAKYRATKNFSEDLIDKNKIFTAEGKKNLFKRMDTMVNTIMINDWLLSTGKSIILKEGDLYYIGGHPLKEMVVPKGKTVTIQLGTDAGNATFKHWMETKVIPDLKQGLTHFDGRKRRSVVRENQFISDLQLNIYQNTPNYNVVYAYTLPINMSPRSDEEKALFDTYKSEFMALDNNSYGHYFMGKASVGKLQPIRIVDLFFLYQAIVTQDKAGESNLHSIFNDMQDAGIIKEFYDFVNEFDRNGDVSLANVPKSQLKVKLKKQYIKIQKYLELLF